jgi:hypothetical protein
VISTRFTGADRVEKLLELLPHAVIVPKQKVDDRLHLLFTPWARERFSVGVGDVPHGVETVCATQQSNGDLC